MLCDRWRLLILLLEVHEHKKTALDSALAADQCHVRRDLSCSPILKSLQSMPPLDHKIRRHRHTVEMINKAQPKKISYKDILISIMRPRPGQRLCSMCPTVITTLFL